LGKKHIGEKEGYRGAKSGTKKEQNAQGTWGKPKRDRININTGAHKAKNGKKPRQKKSFQQLRDRDQKNAWGHRGRKRQGIKTGKNEVNGSTCHEGGTSMTEIKEVEDRGNWKFPRKHEVVES